MSQVFSMNVFLVQFVLKKGHKERTPKWYWKTNMSHYYFFTLICCVHKLRTSRSQQLQSLYTLKFTIWTLTIRFAELSLNSELTNLGVLFQIWSLLCICIYHFVLGGSSYNIICHILQIYFQGCVFRFWVEKGRKVLLNG